MSAQAAQDAKAQLAAAYCVSRFDAAPDAVAKPFGEEEPVAGPNANPTGFRGLVRLGPDVPVADVVYQEGFLGAPGLRPGAFPSPSLVAVKESNTLKALIGPPLPVQSPLKLAFCNGPTVGPL